MRVLQVFNRYLERGGEEMSVERVAATLSREHKVFHCYFDSEDLTRGGKTIPRLIGQAFSMIYNRSSVTRFKRQMEACRPDIILMHNIFPVGSIGVYHAALKSGIPVLHYIHNFRPFSVNGYLWGGDQMILGGLQKNFWPEILAGSWQNSRIRTAWYAAVILLMHKMGIYRRMTGWLAISKFMKETFVKAGIPEDKVFLLRHSWEFEPTSGNTRPVADQSVSEPSILFFGRLTEAKGLRVLMAAWKKVEAERNVGRLVIGGDGPLADWLTEQQSHLRRMDFLGFVAGDKKKELLRQCRAMVVPSVWWEPLGLVVYEAYQYCRPVIAARSGGLTETVQEDQTGWLYEPTDVDALKDCLIAALDDRAEADRRGNSGRIWLEKNTTNSAWMGDFQAVAMEVIRRRNIEDQTAGGKEGMPDAGISVLPSLGKTESAVRSDAGIRSEEH